MNKVKYKVCLILTMVGVILIIVIQTIISLDDEVEEKEINYIKVNAVKAAKKCILDKVCEEGDVTFALLIEKEYLTGYFLEEIKDYSNDSYVEFPSYEVNLIKK